MWQGGYLHTGDIGTIDAEGYLKITDRIKDVIKTGGEWISSLDLEDLLLRHPAVTKAAVIGIPDAKWGERPLALVVAKPDQPVDEVALQIFLRDYANRGIISKYGIPEQIIFVDTIATTSVGKLDKKKLREQYAPLRTREA
ncbi:MAG: AMP-binding protein [Desulfobacterales bacterium]|nr:AMP-binding protein [Desulfobacterales bacterium]